MSEEVQMVDPRTLRADPRNPRASDTLRMQVLELSLRKLGFLMPIYVDTEGEIVSGHQRTTAAINLGMERIPVTRWSITNAKRVGSNLISNRATCDWTSHDNSQSMLQRVADLAQALEGMDDMDPVDWPVHGIQLNPLQGLEMPEGFVLDRRAAALTVSMIKKNMHVPIVVDTDSNILNGKYRYIAARELGLERYLIVTVNDDLAELCDAALNSISMDFNAENEEFKDFLRANSFRRPKIDRATLPRSFRFWVDGCSTKVDNRSFDGDFYRKFRDLHGTTVLDFGAGKARSAGVLAEHGVCTSSFEPYVVPDGQNTPDPDSSRASARRFLEEIGDGRKFNSIFLSSVLNSVAMPRDRMVVLAIVNALCTPDTVVYGTMRHAKRFNYVNTGLRQEGTFVWQGEPLTKVGESWANVKIQKYLWPEDIEKMLLRLFYSVNTWDEGSGGINIFFWRAMRPKLPNRNVLRDAIESEFEMMPYRDGSRMRLGGLARQVFRKRLGMADL